VESDLTDADLVSSIAAGTNASAEASLYRRFARRIEMYGMRHLGSRVAAEDLVQQVMLRVLMAIREGRLENPGSLASFVLGTCRNVTWDTRRAQIRQRAIEREAAALEDTVEPPGVTESDVRRLMGCMGRLPEREALVVRMTFLEDREVDEIAARLAVTSGNLRVIRHRALAKLAACLEGAVSQ